MFFISYIHLFLNGNRDFSADYHRLRVGGLILAAVLCLIGITILFSKTQITYTHTHSYPHIHNHKPFFAKDPAIMPYGRP